MRVSGLCDAKMLSVFCAGMISWYEPEIGGKTVSALETVEVTDLGEQRHGGMGLHADEALQLGGIFPVVLHLRELLNSGIVQIHLLLELVVTNHVLLQDFVHNAVAEIQLVQPVQMTLAPFALAVKDKSVSAVFRFGAPIAPRPASDCYDTSEAPKCNDKKYRISGYIFAKNAKL